VVQRRFEICQRQRQRQDAGRRQLSSQFLGPLALDSQAGPAMKTARILEEDDECFGLEYDNNLGQKYLMRLEAATYERAVREAKSFLGIDKENLDTDGTEWKIE
jgi:hypothetical protein